MRFCILALLLTACGTAIRQPYVDPSFRVAPLASLLSRVASWQAVGPVEHLEIDVDESREGIGFERIDGRFQLWTTICGPDRQEQFLRFEEFARVHGLDCSMYSGERLNSCNQGHICSCAGLSGVAFADLGRQALAEVFGLESSITVRYVVYGDGDS